MSWKRKVGLLRPLRPKETVQSNNSRIVCCCFRGEQAAPTKPTNEFNSLLNQFNFVDWWERMNEFVWFLIGELLSFHSHQIKLIFNLNLIGEWNGILPQLWNWFAFLLSLICGLRAAASRTAPQRRENEKKRQIDWTMKEEGRRESAAEASQIKLKWIYLIHEDWLALPAAASGSPSSSCCAASQRNANNSFSMEIELLLFAAEGARWAVTAPLNFFNWFHQLLPCFAFIQLKDF